MPISFPANPSVNDTFTSGNRTWQWTGYNWKVVTGTVPAGSVSTNDIANDAVTAAKIADNAVETAHVSDTAIQTAHIADSAITTGKIAAGAVVEADIAANAVTTEKLGTDVQLGYRNVIINGGFDVWQRGTTTTVTGSAYLADRFRGSVNGGGGGIQSRDTDVPSGQGFLYSWKHAATVTNSFMQMGQQIEFVNCKHLQNKTVTISFWAKAINSNAGSTGLFVRTRTIAGVDGIVLFAGSASATSITLTTSWARYTITKLLPASFGSLSLEFAIGSHVSGDGFFLTGVQLEAGAVATPFEFEDYGTTLLKCERYYQVIGQWATYWATATATCAGGVIFPTRFRTTPALVSGSQSATYRYGPGGQRSSTLVSFQDIYDTTAYCIITDNGGTPFTTNFPVVAVVGAQFSAEF